jgi:hypothetical protein
MWLQTAITVVAMLISPIGADPLTRATEGMELVRALAERGADPDRVRSEVYATVTGWIGTRGAVPAIETLRDQLGLALDVARAELRNGIGEYAPGIRYAERLIACLEEAQKTAAAVLAAL